MTKDNIKDSVIDMLSRMFADMQFERDVIEYIDLIDDAGMDSITFISIVVEIEAEFNITVPDEMLLIENFKNADSITNIIEQELSKDKDEDDGQA
ncbi:MAG: acyl carrier protein [Clostridia bacterium]|nr:acyl carrier protein [Clostridia bacterium]